MKTCRTWKIRWYRIPFLPFFPAPWGNRGYTHTNTAGEAPLDYSDCKSGNEKSHVKASQVWDLLASQASVPTHVPVTHYYPPLTKNMTGSVKGYSTGKGGAWLRSASHDFQLGRDEPRHSVLCLYDSFIAQSLALHMPSSESNILDQIHICWDEKLWDVFKKGIHHWNSQIPIHRKQMRQLLLCISLAHFVMKLTNVFRSEYSEG